jgi:hypothetical protein
MPTLATAKAYLVAIAAFLRCSLGAIWAYTYGTVFALSHKIRESLMKQCEFNQLDG